MSRIYHLPTPALERGSYPIQFTWKGNDGLVIDVDNINEMYWWLTDFGGHVINGRSRQTVSLANPWTLVLKDEDLQITDKDSGENTRIVTLRGTYNSTIGSNIDYVYQVSFDIVNSVLIDSDLNIVVIDPVYVRDAYV